MSVKLPEILLTEFLNENKKIKNTNSLDFRLCYDKLKDVFPKLDPFV